MVLFKKEMQFIDILGVGQHRSLILIELGPVFNKLYYLVPKILQTYSILDVISNETGTKRKKLLIVIGFWKLNKHCLTH